VTLPIILEFQPEFFTSHDFQKPDLTYILSNC